MATFTTQPFHELLDSDKTTPSTVLDSDGKLKQSLHNMFPTSDLTDDDWTNSNLTITADGTSPSGKTAYKFLETAVSGNHNITDLITVNDNRYYCISVDVKPIGGRNLGIFTGSAFGSISFTFDLSDGSLAAETHGTKTSAIATELTDGWWNVKVYAEATSNGSTTIGFRIVDGTTNSYLGDTAKGVYVSRPRMYEASVHAPVERFANTDFATDTDWAKTNWTIGSGVASKTVGSFGGLSQAVDLVAGEKYRMEVTVSNYVAGTLTASLASGSGLGANVVSSEGITANGTYVFILTALSSSTHAGFAGSATFDGDIDDVSLTKVIDDGIQNDLDGEDFIETSGSAIYHGGLEYNGDGSFRGIQSFEARTNLVTYSSEFDDSSWITFGTAPTVTANAAVSPSGQLDAYSIDGAGAGSGLVKSQSASASTTYTASLFIKQNTSTKFRLYMRDASVGTDVAYVTATLSSGVVTVDAGGYSGNFTLVGTRVEDYGDDWYRISITATTSSSTSSLKYEFGANDPSGSGDLYIYGAQLEAGSSPSPYIPTTGSTRNRDGDKLHKALSEFGYNHDELTVKAEFESAGGDGGDYPRVFQLGFDNSDNFERHDLLYDRDSGNLLVVNRTDDTTNAYLQLGTGPTNQLVKVMAAYKENDYAASDDGDTVVTDTTGALATVDTLYLGNQRNTDNRLNGYIKKLIIWPKRLANATLEAESE